MPIISRIETHVSDIILSTCAQRGINYPSVHCITPEESVFMNRSAIKKMKEGETVILRQVYFSEISHFSNALMPEISAITAKKNYEQNHGDIGMPLYNLKIPNKDKMSVDFVSVHKRDGKYVFKALEADGPQHAIKNQNHQQLFNDAITEEALRKMNIELKRVSEGILDCSDCNSIIQYNFINWILE